MAGDDEIPIDDGGEVLDVSALIDAHFDAPPADDFEADIPTVVEVYRVCPGCGKDALPVEDTDQPPASHAQAWRAGGLCRGNSTWFWCRAAAEHNHVGTLTIFARGSDGRMDVLFFPDRRVEARPVPVERRGLPPGAPRGSR